MKIETYRGNGGIQLAALLLLGLMFVTDSCTSSMANSGASAYAGEQLPAFTLKDYNGSEVSLSDYEGKFLVMHFATTWCPFCNAEAPYLQKLHEDYSAKGVRVLIIDVKEDRELVKRKLIDRFGLTFPVLFDTDGSVAASFAPPDVLPDLDRDEVMLASNLLIDPEGKVQFFSLLDTQNFDAQLNHLKSKLDELL